MSLSMLSFLLVLTTTTSLNEMIGGEGVSTGGTMTKMLHKTGSLSAVISDLFGDETMYSILMDPRLKQHVGDYSFLKVEHKMSIKVDKPTVLFGILSNKDEKCRLTYQRPYFNAIHFDQQFGWETNIQNLEVTQTNMYQLAIIVLVDLMVFNFDRTTFHKAATYYDNVGHQHEENMMLYKHNSQHFSFLPIDNSWALSIQQMDRYAVKDWDEVRLAINEKIKQFQDTIRSAVDDIRRFAKEFMNYGARLLFRNYGAEMKGFEKENKEKTIKKFEDVFHIVWNDEIGTIVAGKIKEEAMKLDEYLKDIQSRYTELKCGKIIASDIELVMEMKKNILENVKIFEEQNKKQWVPLKQNAMNSYHDIDDYESDYGYDQEYEEYQDLNHLISRLSFLKGYVSGYRKGGKE